MAPLQIHQKELMDTLGESVPSYTTVKRRMGNFQRGRKSVENERRQCRPSTATTKENMSLALDIITQDLRLPCRQGACKLNVSFEQAQNILRNELGLSKVSVRWVQRLLTPKQKRTRCYLSRKILELLKSDFDTIHDYG